MNTLPENQSITSLAKQTRLIMRNYKRWFGRDLVSEDADDEKLVKTAYFAPFAILSAGTEDAPVLNYGNQVALQLWEMSWTELTQTPGHETAEPMEREERSRFLEAVKTQGFVDNYQGIRISKSGRRFEIKQAKVWNLLGEDEVYLGQAATFGEWRFL